MELDLEDGALFSIQKQRIIDVSVHEQERSAYIIKGHCIVVDTYKMDLDVYKSLIEVEEKRYPMVKLSDLLIEYKRIEYQPKKEFKDWCIQKFNSGKNK